MLELLVTSHGSSESWGVKQGTGCSGGLRAINIPDGGGQGQYRPKERKKKRETDKKMRLSGKEWEVFYERRIYTSCQQNKRRNLVWRERMKKGNDWAMKGIKRFQLPFSWLVNSLLALETLLPMSARERKLDFLVWWRCFLNNVYVTFSFSSAFSWPLSIWLSMIVSVKREQLVTSSPKNVEFCKRALAFWSTYRQPVAAWRPPGPAWWCPSQYTFWVPSSCAGTAWPHEACSIAHHPSPPSPQTWSIWAKDTAEGCI